MGPAYEFRKVYADAIGADGTVAVVYLNHVCLAGVWTGRSSIERYGPDGARTVLDTGAVPLPDDGFPWPAGVDVAARLGPWSPPPPPTPPLRWDVPGVRTEARIGTVSGLGYVDRVRITRPTRLLGLRTLVWGRVHLPDRTVVFEHLDTARGERWDVGVDWRLDETAPRALAGPVALEDGVGEVPLSDGVLRLRPDRVLHDGDAFDPDRVPRAVDRLACRVFGGPTHETRWLGTAELGSLRAPVLYERVVFG